MTNLAIGIDIGGTNLRGALIDEDGKITKRLSIPSEADKGIDFVIENLVTLINEIKGKREILGAGIGIPGIIDSAKGILTQAPNISSVDDYPLRDVLTEKLGEKTRIFIENDANCATVGEWWTGAGKDVNSIVMMTMGTGVGGGIVLDGKLWRGANGMAGEVGHITIYPEGAKCNCGNRGCLESYASANAVRWMLQQGLANKGLQTVLREKTENVSKDRIPEIVMEAANDGDRFALEIWQEVGKALGIAIADLANLLNVEMIIIGGGLSNAWDLFIHKALSEAKLRGLRAPIERARVVRTWLGDDAGLVGAGYLVFNEM